MNRDVFTIDAADPCLDGHFPGRPIVPAVVVLDRVIAVVQQQARVRVTGIRRCKFVRALSPDKACTVEWRVEGAHARTGGTVRFECVDDAGVLARGVFVCADGGHG